MYYICKFTYSCRNADCISKLICNYIYANRFIFWLIGLTIKFNYCLFFLVASNTFDKSNFLGTQLKTESCTVQLELLLYLKRIRLFLDSISQNGSEKSSFALIISVFWLLPGFVLISIKYWWKKTPHIIVMVCINYIYQNWLLIPNCSHNCSIILVSKLHMLK